MKKYNIDSLLNVIIKLIGSNYFKKNNNKIEQANPNIKINKLNQQIKNNAYLTSTNSNNVKIEVLSQITCIHKNQQIHIQGFIIIIVIMHAISLS